jgi:hypothetical protein
VEFLIAGIGVALAVWMIIDARGRHRSDPNKKQDPDA